MEARALLNRFGSDCHPGRFLFTPSCSPKLMGFIPQELYYPDREAQAELRKFFCALLVLSLCGFAARAEDARNVYEARYQLTGYLLRAANVCMGSKKQFEATFALVSSPEMRAFSRAFPKMTEEWMRHGAALFNTSVMKDGLQRACDNALAALRKANAR